MSKIELHSESEILRGIARADESAFTWVYNQYYAEIFYFTKRIVDEETAKDITVEVFVKLWKTTLQFENLFHLLSYLRKVSRNACIDRLRSDKSEAGRMKEFIELTDDKYEETYFRDILEARFFSAINAEIEKLPGHLKAVFGLAYYEGLKNSEIAERLQIKDATVRVAKAEAIKLLRVRLAHSDLTVFLLFSSIIKFL